MPRADSTTKTTGVTAPAEVWGEVRVTLKPADYEAVTVTMGQSRTCKDTEASRTATQKAILDEMEEVALRQAKRVKRRW